VTSDALSQLLRWGVAKEVSSGRYAAVPLDQAVAQLRHQALLSVSGLQQQQQQQQQRRYTLSAPLPETAATTEQQPAAAAAGGRLGRLNALPVQQQQQLQQRRLLPAVRSYKSGRVLGHRGVHHGGRCSHACGAAGGVRAA
jgi:hypothetical protein